MRRFLHDTVRKAVDNKIKNVIYYHKTSSRSVSSVSRNYPLPKLKPINPYSNEITEHDAYSIYLEKCQELDIDTHPIAQKKFIDQFMKSIGKKTLKFSGLGLCGNALVSITKLLSFNQQFIVIDLSKNAIGDRGLLAFGSYLRLDPPIISVDLRSNGLSPESLANFFKLIRHNTHLISLDLSTIDNMNRNRISTEGCQEVAKLLSVNQSLQLLNLGMCGITSDGCVHIGAALPHNTSLVQLNLTANRFESQGFINLFSQPNSLASIESLILSGDFISDLAAPLLCQRLVETQVLKHLDLSSNAFGKKFIQELYHALQNGSRIETLNLSNNKIDSKCSSGIYLIIRNTNSLRHLDLSNNPLGDDSLVTISGSFENNKTLKSINFSNTNIKNKGAIALAKTLKLTKTLEQINLSDNKITDEGGIELAKALIENDSITHFSIRANQIKDESALLFVDVLNTSKTICDIDLNMNDFGYKALKAIKNAQRRHSSEVDQHVVNIAENSLEKLTQKKKEYKDLCKRVIKETQAVEDARALLELKKQELIDCRRTNEEIKESADKEYNRLKNEHEKIATQRRDIMQTLAELKTQVEKEMLEYQQKLNEKEARTNSAKKHLERTENIKNDVAFQTGQAVTDLKTQFDNLKDQLISVLEEAHLIQNRMRRKIEEEERARQEEEEKLERERKEAEEKEKQEKARLKEEAKPAQKMLTIEEIRKKSLKQKAKKKK